MRRPLHGLFLALSSLRLTVILLVFSTLLVFLATIEQVQWGVFEVQKRYFESFLAFWHYPAYWPGGGALDWMPIPLPGGFLLGGLLIVNLLCAHFRYFRASWRKAGIIVIHAGVLLLIVSGFATAYFQQENFMWINVGGRSNYLESFRDVELAFIDHTDPKQDTVVTVPVSFLQPGAVIRHPSLPFTARADFYYPNTGFIMRAQHPDTPKIPADRGVGTGAELGIAEIPYDFAHDTANVASSVISLDSPGGSLGKWFISTLLEPHTAPPFLAGRLPQTFTVDGHTWEVALRRHRQYLPFTLQLDKFIHEKYPGTDVPKRFESQGQLIDPASGETRPILVYMNHPLRYGGLTFYQASFGAGDSASMLQVVRNPGWLLPYLSVAMVGIGMVIQFTSSFLAHLRREKSRATGNEAAPGAVPQNASARS